uniref:Phosphoinositide phospholipase C n=1 Tax=Araucaria cunninghamii TaxID=56994 RepID=A0A0D6R555_ARACU
MGSYRVCLCFQRNFKSDVAKVEDVEKLFTAYSQNGQMSVKHLQSFLVEMQGQSDATEKDAENIVEALKHHALFHRRELNSQDFSNFLFNADLNNALESKVHQDMTAPLSHYFIYTGHNSYLTGNQLSSDCSDAPIIKALKRGVRVIELDIWPNSSKDDILVLHGRTLTAPVEFIRCLESIKVHAFVASHYPVIITLEDHLTRDLQAKAAAMISQTFGELLYYPDSETMEEFPTPESLKGRILISTKPPKEYLESKPAEVEENEEKLKKKTPDEEPWGDEIPEYESNVANEGKNSHATGSIAEDSDDDEGSLQRNADKDAAPEYKRLITIRAGKPKGESLKAALSVDEKQEVKRLSLSEPQLEKVASAHSKHLVRFTQKNILRVYPKGTRITSSNYNPLIAWIHGAQMVALNMQGYGRSLWLVHGFFRANGGCGYVKKPDFLLPKGSETDDQNIFDPKEQRPLKTTLKIKIYMGDGWSQEFKKTHFDAYSPPDFYTRVGIAGVPADTVMKKTHAIEDRWTPCWNEEFAFPLTVPELALLRIEVHEYDMSEKDDFGGQTCLPVTELKSGIRTIPLHDKKGETYKFVRLLVRIEFI